MASMQRLQALDHCFAWVFGCACVGPSFPPSSCGASLRSKAPSKFRRRPSTHLFVAIVAPFARFHAVGCAVRHGRKRIFSPGGRRGPCRVLVPHVHGQVWCTNTRDLHVEKGWECARGMDWTTVDKIQDLCKHNGAPPLHLQLMCVTVALYV